MQEVFGLVGSRLESEDLPKKPLASALRSVWKVSARTRAFLPPPAVHSCFCCKAGLCLWFGGHYHSCTFSGSPTLSSISLLCCQENLGSGTDSTPPPHSH